MTPDIPTFIITIIIASIVIEAITEIIVQSIIFMPLRKFIEFKKTMLDESDKSSVFYNFLYRLLASKDDATGCGYCVSVWVSFFTVGIVTVYYSMPPLLYIINVFLCHRLANLYHSIHNLIQRGRVNTYDLQINATIKGDNDA